MDLILDFSSTEQKGVGEKKVDPKKKYEQDFDDTTFVQYRAYRIKRTDPMTFVELNEKTSFKFYEMWNPYTGERGEKDPFGPLCFHPINLLQYFYDSRLRGLWIDNNDGYEGFFGDAVGAGEDCEVPCRGIYPERYLFRLPVIDCYLKKGHKLSLVTMGPVLTDSEVCQIDRLLTKHWSHDRTFIKLYKKIGSLFKLKHYYDVAISKNPLEMDMSGLELGKREDALKQENPKMFINRTAVEVLKRMI
ncbi:hypothetical protein YASMINEVIRUS_820 [Yasminevirus sp. GU-2018]|uniref:Uncharacterized protein n=1 Tax=Yasminevirus sp. GU-2018 TaxID=2420051 RepID=A0A5K0U8X1_9VIRU|nr:hypothetical protein YASMINEVIRUS_820 [Yasminevirus sp. GU-2018]